MSRTVISVLLLIARQLIDYSPIRNYKMTGTELVRAMRKANSKIQLPDVRHLLKDFEKRELIWCLTPKETESRYYFFIQRVAGVW